MKVAYLLIAFILVEKSTNVGRKEERLKLYQISEVFLWTSLQQQEDLSCPVEDQFFPPFQCPFYI